MPELNLSIMNHSDTIEECLKPWLKTFEAQHQVRIKLSVLNWATAWSDMVKMALHGLGPDVSEIGSTWINNFIAMNALEAFEDSEISNLGPLSNFLPAMWGSEAVEARQQIRAFPWLAYTRAIFYRTDLLQAASVDPSTAFQSPAQLANALERLVGHGLVAPWGVSTADPFDSLHNVASWIWSAGADFVSADGRHLLFNQPQARAGIRAYFDLYRFMQPQDDPDIAFRRGETAIIMSSPQLWTAEVLNQFNTPAEISQHIGTALPFNAPFIGASHLVVWKHTRQSRLALNLIRHLMSAPVQADFAIQAGMLPSRADTLSQPPFSDANFQMLQRALHAGHSFPSVSMWGLIEDKLGQALIQIWRDIFSQSNPEIDTIIGHYLDPLTQRLEQLLLNQI